jgi:hypothetical protein
MKVAQGKSRSSWCSWNASGWCCKKIKGPKGSEVRLTGKK